MKYTGLALLVVLVVIPVVVVIWKMMSVSIAASSRSSPFRMTIDDVFALKKPGSVIVVGVVSEGEVKPGDSLCVKTGSGQIQVRVEALEAHDKPLDRATAGDRVGIMLAGASKEQISPHDLLVDTGKEEAPK
jgi:selenocysteine-specific translation elongation factor